MLVNVSEIDSDSPAWTTYLWRPDDNDNIRTLAFTWQEEQKISRIVLWGNVDGTPVRKILLMADSGYSYEIGSLQENGLPSVIDIPAEIQQRIRKLSITLLDTGSKEAVLLK